MLEAVKSNGLSLQFASEKILSMQFASDELKYNNSFLIKIDEVK